MSKDTFIEPYVSRIMQATRCSTLKGRAEVMTIFKEFACKSVADAVVEELKKEGLLKEME